VLRLLGVLPRTLEPLRPWARLWATRPRFLALAAFLFAGDLKADERLAWVPVDLTLLAGAALSGVLAVRLAQGVRLPGPKGPLLVGLWYLTCVPGVFQAVDSPYAFQKVLTIFTFTLLASLAPFVLVREPGDAVAAANAAAFFCLAITLGGLLGGGAAAAQRLQAFGAGTISLGRATGFLFTYMVVRLAEGAPWPGLTFGVMAVAGVTALFAGSRGPIVAALAVLALLLACGRQRLGRGVVKLTLAAGLLALVVASTLSLAPTGSLRRLESFFQGQYGNSETYRVAALQACWERFPEAPLGLGWGGFATHVDPEKGADRQYPHNLLAEVTLESGWLCGLTAALLLALANVAAWSRTTVLGGRVVFAGLLFYLINGMVSGDVNDNRPLFMFVSSALALWEVRP